MKYIMSNEAKAHNMDILVQVHMCVHNGPGVHMHVEERGVLRPCRYGLTALILRDRNHGDNNPWLAWSATTISPNEM